MEEQTVQNPEYYYYDEGYYEYDDGSLYDDNDNSYYNQPRGKRNVDDSAANGNDSEVKADESNDDNYEYSKSKYEYDYSNMGEYEYPDILKGILTPPPSPTRDEKLANETTDEAESGFDGNQDGTEKADLPKDPEVGLSWVIPWFYLSLQIW